MSALPPDPNPNIPLVLAAPSGGALDFREQVGDWLAALGHPPDTVAALLAIDADSFSYVRRVMKGEVPRALMAEIGTGLELSQFQALSAILRIAGGYSRAEPQEPTVGLLAEELMLDPSRASRIAADLVERGLVARGASQSDGRRSILQPTELGLGVMQAFLAAKWQHNARIFADWSGEDIATFARLFSRFSEAMRREYPSS